MLAVVCPVKTRAMPSWTPLSSITPSTWPVILTSSVFALDLTLMALVKTFIYPPWERKSALSSSAQYYTLSQGRNSTGTSTQKLWHQLASLALEATVRPPCQRGGLGVYLHD